MAAHQFKVHNPVFSSVGHTLVWRITTFLLLLSGAMGVTSRPVQAGQVVASLAPEGVKPARAEQDAYGPIESIDAGGENTCGLLESNGAVFCWSDNFFGESQPAPGGFTQVSAGIDHTCGVRSNGILTCWGAGKTVATDGLNYGQSILPAGTFTQVSAGLDFTCGLLKSDGTIACWGDNSYGQSTPPSGTFTQISAGQLVACGLKSDGALACWGFNGYGVSNPPVGTFTQVTAGSEFACGLKSDGTLACWGINYSGQTNAPAGMFTQVSAGEFHACGLKSDGTVACWGENEMGEANPPAGTFTQVSAGWSMTCGLKSDGNLACWGGNFAGQLNAPIFISGSVGVAGATLKYTEGKHVEVTISASDGSYVFAVPSSWSGTVTLFEQGYTFSPVNRSYTNVLANQNAQNYILTQFITISGNVGGACAALTYRVGNNIETVIADNKGNYSLVVPCGWSGTVVPSLQCVGRNCLSRYTFTPSQRAYTNLLADQSGQNYTLKRIY